MSANKYAKRGGITMPVEPPREVLIALAGYPAILDASDEQWVRDQYAVIRKALAERKK